MHIHGDMKTPEGYAYLTKLAREAGVEGFHLDENHPPEWIKENVIKKPGYRPVSRPIMPSLPVVQ